MVTYLPISSPFIRFAGRYFDEALCVATGWNFFVFQAFQIPFEATACNMILNFWTDRAPVGAIVAIVLVLYLYVDQAKRHQIMLLFADHHLSGFSMSLP